LGGCETGESKITAAYKLPSSVLSIIHVLATHKTII